MILIILVVQCIKLAVSLPELFPYGIQFGDQYMQRNDDGSSPKVPIQSLFPFFNNQHDSLYVNTNGAISFLGTLSQYTPDPFPLSNGRRIIAPYWTDVDIRYGGNISYRESTDPNLLRRASDEIQNTFSEQYKFHASWIFIATWHNVPFYGASGAGLLKRNTFQCVLVTNGRHSFAIFLYTKMVWTTGTASGGDASTGLEGIPAQVGFNAGNSINYFAVDESRTPDIVNIDQMSNVNVPGKFIFRIDTERIEAGGCNTGGTLTVTPRYGTMLGGQRIHIGGPCVTVEDRISVKYGEFEKTYNCKRENDFKVTCVTPMFYQTGDITIGLIVNHEGGTISTYNGVYSFLNPVKVDPVVYRHRPRYWIAGETHAVSWDITNIPFKANFIRLDVFYLQENIGYLKWIHGGCLKSNVSIYELEQSIVIFPESYVAAIKLTPVGDESIWERDGVWSDIFSLVPRTSRISEELCSSWHADDFNLPLLPADCIQPCPCTLQQALLDTGRFHRDPLCDKFSHADNDMKCLYNNGAEHCIRLNTPLGESGFGKQCCYDHMGNLMGAYHQSGAGTLHRYHYLGDNDRNIPFLSNFYFDIVPRQQCCLYVSQSENNINENNPCRKFLDRRPLSDCSGYQPPRPAFVYGDPHFKTVDGLSYTFNGFGEFLLLHDAISGLVAQVRLEQAVNERGVKMSGTLVTSFVVRTVNFTDVIEVQLNSIRVADVLINGVIADFTDIRWIDYKGVSILCNENNSSKEVLVMIQHPKISFKITATQYLLNIMTVFGDEGFKGNIRGLFGNYDGNPDNDFMPRNGNGSVLSVNSSSEFIHKNFGETWRITEEESLFTYPIGETYATFFDPNFVPSFTVPTIADNRTKEICGNSENCIFDLHTTGVTDVAVSTKETVEVIEEMEEIFQPIIACGFPPATKSGVWNYSGLTEGNTAVLTCNDKLVIFEEIIKCQSNGRWTDVKVSCIHGTSQNGSKFHNGIDIIAVFVIIGGVLFGCFILLICIPLKRYMKRRKTVPEKF